MPICTFARTDGEADVSTGAALFVPGLEDVATLKITRATTTTTTTPAETNASVVDENLRGAATGTGALGRPLPLAPPGPGPAPGAETAREGAAPDARPLACSRRDREALSSPSGGF